MKKHVWRPLYVVIGIVAVILLARLFIVPNDFGIQERGYMYGFHRAGNEQEWKDFPNKFKTTDYCNECHDDKIAAITSSPHRMIPCENCHGAAFDHPENPEKLPINRSRDLCIRCHSQLFTPGSGRAEIPGINPDEHNTGMECVECHNPHHPNLEEM